MDTHVWLWLMAGNERLGEEARRAIDAAGRDGKVRVSAISVWEVGMLEAKGRIRLDAEINVWIGKALSVPGLFLVALERRRHPLR